MKLTYYPYQLRLKRPFSIAQGSRSTTAAVLVEVEQDGIVGYGEASMPPYLGESVATASAFLARVGLEQYDPKLDLEKLLSDVDALEPGNHAAKAAVDIALHDWAGKNVGEPWYRLWGLDPAVIPPTSFTIGIDSPEGIREQVAGAGSFPIFKVKLGGESDREIINTLRNITDKRLRVDVNQGWRDKSYALNMIEWLATHGVEFVEQPMPREMIDDILWLSERSPLPIVADEAVARLRDVWSVQGLYHGINVKLMKCTGMNEARKMIVLAKSLGMKVMLGCMTETSCAISAAAHLAPLANWVDLDGALLISNDPFHGAEIVEGRVVVPARPGIGAEKIE